MSFKRSILTVGITLTGLHATNAQNTLGYIESETHFRNGLEYFEKSNFLAARQEFDEYLKSKSGLLPISDYNMVTAEYYIAVTGLYLDYPEAEILVDRFVRNHAEHPKAQLIFGDLGRYYYEGGEYDKAIGYLEKAVRNSPSSTKTLENSFRLAMSYYQLKRPLDALPLFNKIKQEPTFPYAPDASYYAGVINYENGNYRDAYQDFIRIQNHETYKNEVPNWIVSSLYHQNQFDELLVYGERVLSQSGLNNLEEVALYVAEVYYEKGNYKAAVPAYERYKAMKTDKVPPAVTLHHGFSLFKNNSFQGVVDVLKPVAASKDSVGQYSSYLSGISYLKTGSPAFALTAFDNASKLPFNKVVQEEAAFNRAKVLLEMGNSSDAIKSFNEFALRYPSSKHEEEATQLTAEAYAGASNSAGAITYIEGLKKRTPEINATYQRLTFNQGIVEFNADDFSNAGRNFDKSIKYPIDEDIFIAATFFKAESYKGLKRMDNAITVYTQLLKHPKAGLYARKSLYSLGYIYYNQKNYSKALTFFKDFVANTTGIDEQVVADAYIRLADSYLAGKNYDEAIRNYDRVATLGKIDKDYALFQKGRAFIYMNRNVEARRQFDLLLNGYPQSMYVDDALFQIADVDFQEGNYSQAVKGFTRLVNDQPKSYMVPAALLRRGQSYYNIQVYEQAIADFKRILAEYPSSPSANSALEGVQESLNAVGRPEEFSQVLGVVRKNNPQNDKLEDVEFQNAINLYQAGKYANAITAFNEFIKSYSSSKSVANARYYIASSYDKQDDVASALRMYAQVIQENRSQFVAEAAERSATLEIGRGNHKNAITSYRALLKNAESKKEQVTAWMGLMDTYWAVYNLDSTYHFAREVAGAGNIIQGAVGKAQLFYGKIPYEKGDYVKATEEFSKITKAYNDAVGAEAKYWLSMILFKSKKYKEAEASIFELSKQYDGYDYWRVRSFLLLAEVYLANNELSQAKATLTSIIENSEDQEALTAAKAKLAELDKK